MGNKLPIKVLAEPEDLFSRNKGDDLILADLLEYHNLLMTTLVTPNPIRKYPLSPEFSSWNEPTTKQSKVQNSLNWKSLYYALQYGMGPKRLSMKRSLAAIASGSTSDGTPPKGKKNGN